MPGERFSPTFATTDWARTMTTPATQYLYRILPFDRAVQMLRNDELYFAHPRRWEDPFEQRLQHKRSNAMFAQCWCRKGISDAMWRIYSPTHQGVRIRTTKDRLKSALKVASAKREFRFSIRNVTYDSESIIEMHLHGVREALKNNYSYEVAIEPFFVKRSAFSHEAEVRVVLHDPAVEDGSRVSSTTIPVKSRWLIDSILLDPRAPIEYVEAYTHYLKDKMKFPGTVRQSSLYASPDPIEA